MSRNKKTTEKVPAVKPNQPRKHDNTLVKEEQAQTRSTQDQLLHLQKKVGNKAATRMLQKKPVLRSDQGRILRTPAVSQAGVPQVQRSVEPWKDKKSRKWKIRSLGGAEIAIGIGKLRLEFELMNRRSGEIYDAIYDGQVAGVAAGLSISMSPSWIKFSTARKVRPSGLDGLGAEVRALGVGIGIISFSSASMKLPNEDTVPSRIDIGGINASFGISASAFYSGGTFRIYKKPGAPTA